MTKKEADLLISATRDEEIKEEKLINEDPVFQKIKSNYETEKTQIEHDRGMQLNVNQIAQDMFDKELIKMKGEKAGMDLIDNFKTSSELNRNIGSIAFNTKKDKYGNPIWLQ